MTRQFTGLIFLAAMFGLTASIAMPAAPVAALAPICQRTVDIDGKRAVLAAYDSGPLPAVSPNGIRLLDGGPNESNSAIFDRDAGGQYRHVHVSWTMSIGIGGEGASFVMLSTQRFGTRGALTNAVSWDDPRVQDSFAVAFDVRDPPTSNPFNADLNNGNPPVHWTESQLIFYRRH